MSEHKAGEWVRSGSWIVDNDPRMKGRQLHVKRIWWPLSGDPAAAKAVTNDRMGREFSILLRRIHVDGKQRKSGFSLLPPPPGAEDGQSPQVSGGR